ncbi:MAG: DUF3662 domain-containing protein [Anaerolineae bacterium]|nr:DUF3662 domain-containing protein [Anaerolineae bacterium]
MPSQLKQIEEHLQKFIEQSVKIIPWITQSKSLIHQLAEAMYNGIRSDSSGNRLAPNIYTIYLNPEVLLPWQRDKEIVSSLTDMLQNTAAESGISFESPPIIRLAANPELPTDTLQITAAHYQANVESTSAMPVLETNRDLEESGPVNAYLILDNNQVFPLTQPVINIGRRPDNHLVITDPRVSRTHAQLRAVKNHFYIFDLNATGGTYVNNHRVARCVLKPGDVISLAGVEMIYGEDIARETTDPSEITGNTASITP